MIFDIKIPYIKKMDSITTSKIIHPTTLFEIIQKEQSRGKHVVFTNGCFDIIHTGHTRYLREARSAGDFLVVAVNSDESVQQLKGEKRPIVPLQERMEILAGFYFVDYVVSFNELDPLNIIKTLSPNTLIKGGDWPVEKVIGKDFVESNGGSVFTIPEIPGASTTSIVELILERYQS
ncbi:MAG: rfaE bifunctional protein nucleotidyltransferase chain/domain [bacterium]